MNRLMKRISLMLTASIIFCSLAMSAISVSAAEPPALDKSKTYIEVGTATISSSAQKTVDVDVVLGGNTNGIWGMRFMLSYDNSKLKLTNTRLGTVFNSDEALCSPIENELFIYTADFSDLETNNKANGTLVTLTFELISDEKGADLPIAFVNYDDDDFFKVDFENVPVTFGNGAVLVRIPTTSGSGSSSTSTSKTDVTTTSTSTEKPSGSSVTSTETTATTTSTSTTAPVTTSTTTSTSATSTTKTQITTIPPYDASKPNIVIGDVKATPGGTVTVPVKIDKNPGIWSVRFDIAYDRSVLTLKDAAFEGDFAEGSMISPLSNKVLTYTWENDNLKANSTASGVLVNLIFEVSKDAKIGDMLKVGFANYDPDDFFRVEGTNGEKTSRVAFTFKGGEIKVEKAADVRYGDVNTDNKINAKDVMLVRQYIAELIGKDGLNIEAADVSPDEKINAKDVMFIRQVIAELIEESKLPAYKK